MKKGKNGNGRYGYQRKIGKKLQEVKASDGEGIRRSWRNCEFDSSDKNLLTSAVKWAVS